MQLSDLCEHLKRGGAATLNHPATYSVPSGAIVAPARYAGRNGSEFVFETRFVDDAFRRTALIDSKQSQSNRAEDGLLAARNDGTAALQIPTIEVVYAEREPLSDLALPHRAFDAHIRFGSQDGVSVVKQRWYQSLRDATLSDLSAVFVAAPSVLAFGGWDSTRRSGQLRLRGLFVSELFGVVDDGRDPVSHRSGARLDPLGQDFHITLDQFESMIATQREHLSPKKVTELEKAVEKARRAKDESMSASPFVIGGIPPSLDSPFGVAVPEVRRARSYSLAGLRRLRFGGDPSDDVAARKALLATLLLGAAYADADPEIRAYCDVSAPRAHAFLDDERVELDLSIDACEAFLAESIDRLPERLAWRGQKQVVAGDEALSGGAHDDGGGEA
jgi:CRISPR-associated protein Csb1